MAPRLLRSLHRDPLLYNSVKLCPSGTYFRKSVPTVVAPNLTARLLLCCHALCCCYSLFASVSKSFRGVGLRFTRQASREDANASEHVRHSGLRLFVSLDERREREREIERERFCLSAGPAKISWLALEPCVSLERRRARLLGLLTSSPDPLWKVSWLTLRLRVSLNRRRTRAEHRSGRSPGSLLWFRCLTKLS